MAINAEIARVKRIFKMERPAPKPYQLFRHFKGGVYKIIVVGHHSETHEPLVVYFNVHNPDARLNPCIRPLDMFMSEVDCAKYPDAKQKYRFELIKG